MGSEVLLLAPLDLLEDVGVLDGLQKPMEWFGSDGVVTVTSPFDVYAPPFAQSLSAHDPLDVIVTIRFALEPLIGARGRRRFGGMVGSIGNIGGYDRHR